MRKHKYGAKPIEVDGIRFASQKEARRYQELKLLVRAGHIDNLTLQHRYELQAPGGKKVGSYIADFVYDLPDGEAVVEDVKGFKTPLYRWKKRHVEAQYGIVIREV